MKAILIKNDKEIKILDVREARPNVWVAIELERPIRWENVNPEATTNVPIRNIYMN